MTKFKEVDISEGDKIFITFHENNIYAIGNIDNIVDKLKDEINNYIDENNYDFVNLIIANDFQVYNILA